MVQFRYTI